MKTQSENSAPIAMSIAKAAEYTGLSVSTLIRAARAGRLRPRKIGARTLYLLDDLRALIENAPPAGN